VKDKQGEWQDNPHWNEVVIFHENTRGYVKKHIEQGDLVFARGRVRQGSYEKDGETRYTVDLISTDFSRLANYLGSWLEVLRDDNRAIVRAASQASEAADYILGFLQVAFLGSEQELFKIVRRHYQPKTATTDLTIMPPQRGSPELTAKSPRYV
jgi:antirestriction protein ArdC